MMTNNGISTTKLLGEEQYEKAIAFGRKLVFYDYRDLDGELFSTTSKSLEICRQKRDAWLQAKQLRGVKK